MRKIWRKIGVPISNENFLDTNKPTQDLKEEKATRENQGNTMEDTKTHEENTT
jgi:hypothetical protein